MRIHSTYHRRRAGTRAPTSPSPWTRSASSFAALSVLVAVGVLAFAVASGSEPEPLAAPPPIVAASATAPVATPAEAARVTKTKQQLELVGTVPRGSRASVRVRAGATGRMGRVLLPDLRRGAARVRRQLAPDRCCPPPGDGLNERDDLSPPQLRRLLRWSDADSTSPTVTRRVAAELRDNYKLSYRQGSRPKRYLSMRDKHPSLYDDFDAIMAGAHLLRDNGAGADLDASAWSAAYDYYGHDLNGVAYASQSQHARSAGRATASAQHALIHRRSPPGSTQHGGRRSEHSSRQQTVPRRRRSGEPTRPARNAGSRRSLARCASGH